MNKEDSKPLIWIRKIIQRSGQPPVIEDDIVRKKDIKRIRRWHKSDYDNGVEGEITQITLETSSNIQITVKVNEPLESLAKRLETVHEVN